MRKSRAPALRALLRGQFVDGATAKVLCASLGLPATETCEKTVFNALAHMPDTYVDRWLPTGGALAAVWCAVAVPENCPKPEPKGKRK